MKVYFIEKILYPWRTGSQNCFNI